MNKKYHPTEVRQISARLKKFGIGRMGFLLLGGPGETKGTALESIEFADSFVFVYESFGFPNKSITSSHPFQFEGTYPTINYNPQKVCICPDQSDHLNITPFSQRQSF
jgi:hypothetical protein